MNTQFGSRWMRATDLAPFLLIAVLSGAHPLLARVYLCGDNQYGQAGWIPYDEGGARAVAAGYWHNLMIQKQGNVVAWGLNSYGQASVPDSLKSPPNTAIAVAAGRDHSLALYSSSRLVLGWGDNTYGQTTIPPGLSDVIAIAAGAYHNAALLSNGRVVCWGYNAYGQTNVPPGLTNAIAVTCGNAFTLALKSDGTVVGWGDNYYGQTDIPANLTNAVAIAAGFAHCLAVRQDGRVVGWGDTSLGQGRPPADLTDATAVTAGYAHSLAVRRDRTVVGWGDNAFGQRTFTSTNMVTRITAVAAGYGHSVLHREDRPEITSQPRSVTTNAGAVVKFYVFASGIGPMGCLWKFNGSNVAVYMINASTFLLPSVTTNDAGNYWVVVTNNYGSDTSQVATLTILPGPAISTNLQSQSVNQGGTAVFRIGATGTGPLQYQWRFCASNSVDPYLGAVDLPEATSPVLAVTNAQPENGGRYFVVVRDTLGAVTSQVATLTVRVPPAIINQPADIATNLHATVSFSVVAMGTQLLSYRWWFNGVNLGITSSTLTLSDVTTNQAGSYWVTVSNVVGVVTSRVATLTVLESVVAYPLILTNPVNQTVDSGRDATFAVEAGGAPPLSYQWRFHATNGVSTNFVAAMDLPGATSSSLLVRAVQPTNGGGYSVVVINANGWVTSRVALLIVRAPPSITAEPEDTAAIVGATAVFEVQAAGIAPLSYQWGFNNGTNVIWTTTSNVIQTGSSKSTLMLNHLTLGDAGAYFVVVTNPFGSVTSRLAKLDVFYAPSLTPTKLFALTHPGASGFGFTVALEAGKNYRIQGSTNLRDWVDLTNLLSTSASMDFLDLATANASQMFYRVVSP